MEFQFLGTCAADFSDKLNNEYKNCFDKNARRSSSSIINTKVLIDCGPHTINSLEIAKIDCSKIECIVFTHLHDDHFNLENIKFIAAKAVKPLKIFARNDAVFPEIENIEFVKMEYFTDYTVIDGLTVSSMPANHNQNFCPQWLLFKYEDKKILYALDGGWIIYSSYYFLRNANLSLAVLDATIGDYSGDYRIAEHNSIPMIRLLVDSFKTLNVVNSDSKIYITHLAPSLHKSHDETVKVMKEAGINVAFDGLKINI